MTTFAIAGLQLEAQNGNNVDSMLAEIDSVVRRYPWINMVVLGELNEPLLRPVRRMLPPIAGIDLSPLLILILLQAGLMAIPLPIYLR